jgi:hypothetical protein
MSWRCALMSVKFIRMNKGKKHTEMIWYYNPLFSCVSFFPVIKEYRKLTTLNDAATHIVHASEILQVFGPPGMLTRSTERTIPGIESHLGLHGGNTVPSRYKMAYLNEMEHFLGILQGICDHPLLSSLFTFSSRFWFPSILPYLWQF